MTKIVVDIDHSISYDELLKFVELSEVWKVSLQETIERCMIEKRDEYLAMFKLNVPDSNND